MPVAVTGAAHLAATGAAMGRAMISHASGGDAAVRPGIEERLPGDAFIVVGRR